MSLAERWVCLEDWLRVVWSPHELVKVDVEAGRSKGLARKMRLFSLKSPATILTGMKLDPLPYGGKGSTAPGKAQTWSHKDCRACGLPSYGRAG